MKISPPFPSKTLWPDAAAPAASSLFGVYWGLQHGAFDADALINQIAVVDLIGDKAAFDGISNISIN